MVRRVIENAAVQTRAHPTNGINLNIAQGQVVELMFVETKPVGEDDD